MKPTKIAKVTGFLVCLTIGVLIGLIYVPVYKFGTSIWGGRHIQTLVSPNGRHSADLLRKHNLADFNFIVKVDGNRVFESPDLAGFPDNLYRETLVWDKTGRIVVLELMGKRVFAYDTREARNLGKGELRQYEFYPMPNDYFYVYLKDIDE